MPIDDKVMSDFDKAYKELGSLGERAIAFADFEFPLDAFTPGCEFNLDDESFALENLRFLGMIAMIDPPRPSVPDAVAKCRKAGIKVIMVTGDHPVTAEAIARAVGIISPESE